MNIIYRSSMPTLDLHGENRISAIIRLKEFLDDNVKLQNMEIAVIHGIGKGILKKEVHSMLKRDKRVQDFGTDYFNLGCTLIKLRKEFDNRQVLCYNTQHKSKGEK